MKMFVNFFVGQKGRYIHIFEKFWNMSNSQSYLAYVVVSKNMAIPQGKIYKNDSFWKTLVLEIVGLKSKKTVL